MGRKITILSLSALFLVTLLNGLTWFSTGIIICYSISFLFFYLKNKFTWLQKSSFFTLVFFLAGVFVLAISFRIFLIEIYSIPSSSMEDALKPGDKVLVSKLNYGPRMPGSPFEVPWVNLIFYLNKQARASIDSTWYGYKRLSGFSGIKRNDVVVFNFPYDKNVYYIKRCIGLPGDTITIKNGEVFYNCEKETPPVGAKLNYRIWVGNQARFNKLSDSLGIRFSHDYSTGDTLSRLMNITRGQLHTIEKLGVADSIERVVNKTDSIPWAYPYNGLFLWTFQDFGPVVIPQKGMQIHLTPENFFLYQKIFGNYEGEYMEFRDGQAYQGGKPVNAYIFHQDYYFMIGDNRYNSYDSRGFGFVPEEGVVGKAILVLFSKDIKRALTLIR
jgi:signal peptidase I